MKCAGIHRALGTHISKVRSITLDRWDRSCVDFMAKTGNRISNAAYLASCPSDLGIHESSHEHDREAFIRDKYEHRRFYGRPSSPSPIKGLRFHSNAAPASAPTPTVAPSRQSHRQLSAQRPAASPLLLQQRRTGASPWVKPTTCRRTTSEPPPTDSFLDVDTGDQSSAFGFI